MRPTSCAWPSIAADRGTDRPGGWIESRAISLDDLGRRTDPGRRPVLAPDPGSLQGAEGAVLERDGSVEVAVTGPGSARRPHRGGPR